MQILQRVAERHRPAVAFTLDGAPVCALEGDTVLTAILTQQAHLRRTEFTGAARAGFCMMGACQDCWVLTESGARLRACTQMIESGMQLRTRPLQGSGVLPLTDPWPPGEAV